MAFLGGIAPGIDDFLGNKLKSPDRKKARGDNTPDRNAFAQPQSAWLKECVGGALEHMARSIDQRFEAIEKQHDEQARRLESMSSLIDEVKELKSEVAKLKEQSCGSSEAPSRRSLATSSAVAAAPQGAQELADARLVARIGNLGEDDEAFIIQDRARRALEEARVPSEWHGPIAATRRKGNTAEVAFYDPQRLQEARLVVRSSLQRLLPEKPVWLDVKKSEKELRPARIVHRAAEYITDIEAQPGRQSEVVKNLLGKQVKVGGEVMCMSCRGSLIWTAKAIACYSAEELELGKAWAEDS